MNGQELFRTIDFSALYGLDFDGDLPRGTPSVWYDEASSRLIVRITPEPCYNMDFDGDEDTVWNEQHMDKDN